MFYSSLVTPALSGLQISLDSGQIAIVYLEQSGCNAQAGDPNCAYLGTTFGVLAIWSGLYWDVPNVHVLKLSAKFTDNKKDLSMKECINCCFTAASFQAVFTKMLSIL